MRPIASSAAAGTISRRVAGSPLARKAGAHTSGRREQAEGREAGPRDDVVIQRERGEHEAGRGQQGPAAAPSQRRRQCHEAGADDRAGGAVLDGDHLDEAEGATASAIAERTALARRAIARVGPSRSMGARSAVCVLMARSSQATEHPIGPRPDAPSGRAVSTDRMTEPSLRAAIPSSAPTALTYGAGERRAASQSKPEPRLADELQRDRLQQRALLPARRRAHAVRRARAAGAHRRARGRRGRTGAPSSRRRRAATRDRRALSPAAAARGRGSARAAPRSASVSPTETTRPAASATASSTSRDARRSIMDGASRGDPRSSARTRPAGSTRVPRRDRRP